MTRGDLVAVGAEHPGEVAEVLRDGEVVVDAGGLGDVADPVAQRPAAGRLAEAPRRSRPSTCWTPTRQRISVDLPHPDGPSRPVTPPPIVRSSPSRTGCGPRTTVRSRISTAFFTMC